MTVLLPYRGVRAQPKIESTSPMKTIAAFSKPIDAQLLVARLGGSGITAYMRDENMITLDWLVSNAIGGVKVDVGDEDFERALEVMNEETDS